MPKDSLGDPVDGASTFREFTENALRVSLGMGTFRESTENAPRVGLGMGC